MIQNLAALSNSLMRFLGGVNFINIKLATGALFYTSNTFLRPNLKKKNCCCDPSSFHMIINNLELFYEYLLTYDYSAVGSFDRIALLITNK